MELADQVDLCPHCRLRLEIACVKFRFGGAAMVSACPNCGIAFADERSGREADQPHAPKLAGRSRVSLEMPLKMMEALKARFALMR
jgi:hypothetical protein